jgi:hypothetical protein
VPVETLRKLQGRVMHLHFKDLSAFGSGHDVPWDGLWTAATVSARKRSNAKG